MGQAQYSYIAHGELPVWNPVGIDHLRDYVSGLNLPEGGSSLDIGCGRGHLLKLVLLQYDLKAIGVDSSSYAIARAKSELARWIWEDSFAAVCSGEVQVYLRKSDCPGTPVRCYLHVMDAGSLYLRCQQQGARIVEELGSKAWGAREFAVETCDGHILRVGHGEKRIDEISRFTSGNTSSGA